MPQVPCPVPLASPQGTAHAAGQLTPARRAQGKARAPVTVPIPLVAILGVAVYGRLPLHGPARLAGDRVPARRVPDQLQALARGWSPARPTQGVMPVARPLP